MSLVNRMLKDLSAREPTTPIVMDGIRIDGPAPGRASRALVWLVLLVAIAAGAWWWLGQPGFSFVMRVAEKPPAAAPVAAAPVAATPEPAAAVPPPAPDGISRFVLADSLSAIPVPRAKPRAPAAAPASKPSATRPAAAGAVPAPAPAKAPVPVPVNESAAAAGHLAEARRALDRGDAAKAEEHLIEALALDPKLHPAREELGTLRVRQQRWGDAERSVRRGMEEGPEWVGYRRLSARMDLARDRPESAIETLAPGAPPVRDDPEYNALLASAYQRVNRHEEASRLYRELVANQPEQGHWWAGYAISRDALGDRVEARQAYARALQRGQLDPRVSRYIRERLDVLTKPGG